MYQTTSRQGPIRYVSPDVNSPFGGSWVRSSCRSLVLPCAGWEQPSSVMTVQSMVPGRALHRVHLRCFVLVAFWVSLLFFYFFSGTRQIRIWAKSLCILPTSHTQTKWQQFLTRGGTSA